MSFFVPMITQLAASGAAAVGAATSGMSAAGVAATAVGTVGSIYAGNQSSAQNSYAARVAEQNQVIAGQQSNAREELIRREMAQRLGQQRAAAAQSGFDPSSGSMLSLQGESAGNAELEALTARYEGDLQAISFGNEAAGYRSQAKAARTTGYLNAAGTLLSGVARYGAPPALRGGLWS